MEGEALGARRLRLAAPALQRSGRKMDQQCRPWVLLFDRLPLFVLWLAYVTSLSLSQAALPALHSAHGARPRPHSARLGRVHLRASAEKAHALARTPVTKMQCVGAWRPVICLPRPHRAYRRLDLSVLLSQSSPSNRPSPCGAARSSRRLG